MYNSLVIMSYGLDEFEDISISKLEMVNLGPARGLKRAGTGRAGPENPGPRASGLYGPKRA